MPDSLKIKELEQARQAVQSAIDDLIAQEAEIVDTSRSHTTAARYREADHWGTLGATRKRLAEIEFLLHLKRWPETLRAALSAYERALTQGGFFDHWLLGQFVVLRAVLNAHTQREVGETDREWDEVCRVVRQALDNGDGRDQMWAFSSLVDLLLVASREQRELPAFDAWLGHISDREAEFAAASTVGGEVVFALERMIALGGGPDRCPALWPTFRQLWRWRSWWRDPAWQEPADRGFDYLWRLVEPRLIETESLRSQKLSGRTLDAEGDGRSSTPADD
jgi:hypothetical protein